MKNFKMTRINWEDWFHNARLFLAPVIVLYVTTVIGVMSQEGHVFSLKDLYLTTYMQGGIMLYLLNSTLDWVRKWSGSNE